MHCSYCGNFTENDLENTGYEKVAVCDNPDCQGEFQEESEKVKREKQNYDEWRTRAE